MGLVLSVSLQPFVHSLHRSQLRCSSVSSCPAGVRFAYPAAGLQRNLESSSTFFLCSLSPCFSLALPLPPPSPREASVLLWEQEVQLALQAGDVDCLCRR